LVNDCFCGGEGQWTFKVMTVEPGIWVLVFSAKKLNPNENLFAYPLFWERLFPTMLNCWMFFSYHLLTYLSTTPLVSCFTQASNPEICLLAVPLV
jgi:hypothetical protein